MTLLVVVVIGGIYGGVASPSEVGALGASLALIFAALSRNLTLDVLLKAARATERQTSMILFILVSAKLITMTLIYNQAPDMVAEFTKSMGVTAMAAVIAVCLPYLVLGMFFDGLSMMVITLPFLVPLMEVLDVDLVWLGVLIVLMIEIGLLTPPLGLNLYVLQAATGETIEDVAIGSVPFVFLQIGTVVLVLMIPALALYLPKLLF